MLSISGYGKNKGVVPLYCEDLFIRMAELQKENPENQYQVMRRLYKIRLNEIYYTTNQIHFLTRGANFSHGTVNQRHIYLICLTQTDINLFVKLAIVLCKL